MATPRAPPQLDTATKFASPAATIRSLSQLLEDDRRTPLATAFSSRPASRTAALQPRPADHTLQTALAAKESEAALLRQQLQQLTTDFKFNLKLLEERDGELERLDKVMTSLKDAAATREAALQDARRALSDREAALREKETRVASLEDRQKQMVELCDRQVADARASRDEEVARCQQEVAQLHSEAAKAKSEIIAGYERQVSAAVAAEREARQRSQELAAENEHVRSQLQRAEARIAEQELSMQRMVAQFEGALSTLQQLEAQYDSLAADAGAADTLRLARIADLERESEALRAARSGLQQERDASVGRLTAALTEAERSATEAKQQYHRAMMDAAEVTEALAGSRQEVQSLRGQVATLKDELGEARARAAEAQSALEREIGTHSRTQGLLETTRLNQDAARRDAQEQERLVSQLREAAAVLEAERNDFAKAAEAAEVKLQAADERAQLLTDQLEQERRLHVQMLESREAELVARWERALDAAHSERATLQQALDLANRQLQAAHRDMETLRLQVQHLRLAGPTAAPGPAAALRPVATGSGGGTGSALPSPAHAGSHSSGMSGGGGRGPPAPASIAQQYEGFEPEAVSPAGSTGRAGSDRQADGRRGAASAAGPKQQPGSSSDPAGPAPNAYQKQLHRHIETLAGKLSNFQRAVEEARQVGHQATQQLAESGSMLRPELQLRQAAVADEQLQQVLAAERQQFEEERQRLDHQLAEQQRLLAEREAELERLQRAEEEKRQRKAQEEEQRQQQQQRRQREEQEVQRRQQEEERRQQQEREERRQRQEAEQQRQWQQQEAEQQRRRQQEAEVESQHWLGPTAAAAAAAPPSTAGSGAYMGSPANVAHASGQWPQPGALRAQPRHLPQQQQGPAPLDLPVLQATPSASSQGQAHVAPSAPAASQQAASYGQRRSVSAALAAAGGPQLHVAAAPSCSNGPMHGAAMLPSSSVSGTASAHFVSAPAAAPMPFRQFNGGLGPAATGNSAAGASSRTAPLRTSAPGAGAAPQLHVPPPPPSVDAVVGSTAGGEDPLARARRQVMAAKSYLRQVAELGSQAAGGASI